MQGPPNASMLSQSLRLVGLEKFMIHHEVLSLGHNYRVTDPHKQTLFVIKGSRTENIRAHEAEKAYGTYAARGYDMSYDLVDGGDQLHARLLKQGAPNQSTFTLTDAGGVPQVQIYLKRGLMGGIEASALWPTGQPMLATSGNLMRHNFEIKDPSGRDVAKVHEDWVAASESYHVELHGPVDPIYPLVFAIAIDYEKVR